MSTYSPNLGFIEPTPFDPAVSNIWGGLLNTNFTLIDSAIAGLLSLSVAGSSNVVLTYAVGATDQSRNAIFQFTGTLTGNIYVLWPATVTREFVVDNLTSGAFTLSVGVNNGSGAPVGTTVLIPQGASAQLYSDGTNIALSNTTAFAGADTQVIYNSNGVLAGSSNLTFDGTNLTSGGYVSMLALRLRGSSSGYAGFASPSVGGGFLWTLPGADGTNGQVLSTNGSNVLGWTSLPASTVTTFSAGTTGFTPNSATSGAVTLAGTLAVANGGTGATTQSGAQSALGVPSTTGTGASGTWGISISGSAASASTATTASTANALNASNSYTAVDFTATSDDAFKDRVGPITNALDHICAMNGFYYKNSALAKSKGMADDRVQVGLSAQDACVAMPELVSPLPSDPEYMTLAYMRMAAFFVEGFKELRAQNEKLRNEIATLKGIS